MKKIMTVAFLFSLAVPVFSQNFGIDESNPTQKLDVGGWVEVGNETKGTAATAGTIRYHSSGKLQFHNGSQWVDTHTGILSTTSFTHWGVNTCPSGSSLVYAGYAGSGHYNHSGSGTNMLCLTNAPSWSGASFSDANQNGALIYGTEFQTSSGQISTLTSFHDRDAVCAVCLVNHASETLMIPGTNVCPTGWTQQYWGYILGSQYQQTKSEFVCVSRTPTVAGSTANSDGALWYPTETELGTLTAPYIQNREVTCTVCTK